MAATAVHPRPLLHNRARAVDRSQCQRGAYTTLVTVRARLGDYCYKLTTVNQLLTAGPTSAVCAPATT